MTRDPKAAEGKGSSGSSSSSHGENPCHPRQTIIRRQMPNPSYLNQVGRDVAGELPDPATLQHQKTKKPKVKAEKVHTSWSQGKGAGEGLGGTRARGALRMNPHGLRRGLPENKTVSPRPEAMGKLLGWARKGRRQRTLCIPPSTSLFPLSSEPARNGSLQASLKAHLPLACCLSWGGRPPRPSAVRAGQASCLRPAGQNHVPSPGSGAGVTRGQTFSGVSALLGWRRGPRARRGAGVGGTVLAARGQRAAALFFVTGTKYCHPVLLSIHEESTSYSNKRFPLRKQQL